MVNIEQKCNVCGEIIKGTGYKMPYLSVKHLKEKHKEDWLKINDLEIELKQIKDKYDLYLYGTY